MRRMVNPAFVVLVTLVVALAVAIEAQVPPALEGTWKLDAAKSKFSPGPAPKSMTVTYSSAGADGMKVVVDITPATGDAQHWEMTARNDGKESPVKGNPAADTVSMKVVDKLTTETTFKKDGKVMAVNTRKLSADGKTLTVTSKGTTVDGKPRLDVQVLSK